MKIKNIFKKAVCGALASVMLVSGFSVFAADPEPAVLHYDSDTDWVAGKQGNKGWYYQYTLEDKYTKYKDASWTSNGGTTAWFGSNSGGSVVGNFYVSQWGMHPGIGANSKPARVWVAPYSGKVRVASVGNVRKTGKWGGQPVTANVVITNSKQKDEKLLWTTAVQSGDVIGEGNSYSLDVDVNKGDRIYFEISCSSQANAGVAWRTEVDYLQASYFSVNGAEVTSTDSIAAGSTVNVAFYESNVITEGCKLLLAVYDDKGRMRQISDVVDTNFTASGIERESLSVTMPTVTPEEGKAPYGGWSIKLIGVTDKADEYYPVSVSDTICLK